MLTMLLAWTEANDRSWFSIVKIVCVFTVFILPTTGFPKRVPIGGLFDGDEMIERAFETAVRAVNENNSSFEDTLDIKLVSRKENVNEDSFEVSQAACRLMKTGVAGMFGPQGKEAVSFMQSMCDTMDVPYITARWYPEQMRGNVINLYPHAVTLSRVYLEVVKAYNWTSYTILYQDTDSLIRMNQLLKLQSLGERKAALHNLGSGPDFWDVLTHVKEEKHLNIILDCSLDILPDVLEQALQIGILTEEHNWIIASLDLQTIDLESYKHTDANITGLRLVNPDDFFVQNIFHDNFYDWDIETPSQLLTDAALMYDAVNIFARGFSRLKQSIQGTIRKLSCNYTDSWEHGVSLINLIQTEEHQGLTGRISFDNAGFRSDFQLDILDLTTEGLEKIGYWHSTFGIHWKLQPELPQKEKPLKDRHFIVMISLTDPFGMYTASSHTQSGNDRYEGFAIDIIKELSNELGFNYTFRVQEDNDYGSYNDEEERWTGMMGEIVYGRADLAITDLTISTTRLKAVDFTTPFMNLGISVLYRIPNKAPPSVVAFLKPFHMDVWLALIGAYIVVSILLLFIGRLCPMEWYNPYPCIKDPKLVKNVFTLEETPFFIIGSILKSNTGFSPRGISTRAVATSWWFFSLLITATYTANLAAFLSMKSIEWPFKTADQLAFQNKILFGAKRRGSTFQFFKNATYEPYQILYEVMDQYEDELMETSNEKGLFRVMREDYAFFMESTSIEYFTQRYCNVTQVGDLLDEKSYGIAMTKGASYRHEMTTALLRIKEAGKINELKFKWWKQKRGGDTCDVKESTKPEALSMGDVYGVFMVTFIGCALSIALTLWEFLRYVWLKSREEDISFKSAVVYEFKFLAKWSSTREIINRK